MISDSQLENKLFEKLHFLAETDSKAAHLEVEAIKAKRRMEAVEEAGYMVSEGTKDERFAAAHRLPDYIQSQTDYYQAELAWKEIRNKRATAAEAIGGVRSLMANRRQGPVS